MMAELRAQAATLRSNSVLLRDASSFARAQRAGPSGSAA
jgi:hypothetical protein